MTALTQRDAQVAYDRQSPPEDDYRLAERADELLAQYMDDPAMVAEADEYIQGSQHCSHYDAMESALADLHTKDPADLLGSDLLRTLYRLAAVQHAARKARLSDMAHDQAERELRECGAWEDA